MKAFLILAIVSLAAGASARSPEMDRQLDTERARIAREKALVPPAEQNKRRIVTRRVTYSGIAVQAIKAENPLQLVNPLAPEQYGNGEDAVMRSTKTGRPTGWKIFSIEF